MAWRCVIHGADARNSPISVASGRSPVLSGLTKRKQQPGRDMLVVGSSELTVRLLGEGLVDEVRIMVAPVMLGPAGRCFAPRTCGSA
jgi:dihydrofolate reductase